MLLQMNILDSVIYELFTIYTEYLPVPSRHVAKQEINYMNIFAL